MSDTHFEEWISRFREQDAYQRVPVRAMFELTYGCNLRCVHCYNPTHQALNELKKQEIFQILDGLAAEGCLWIGFTGGELFTRKDAIEVLRYAREKGMIFNILTNATMITPALADEIQALDPYLMNISVYGATAETYERVTQIPGSFRKFVRGVDLLIERKVPIVLKLVLMTPNVHEFHAMQSFALERKVRYQLALDIVPKVDGSQAPLRYRLSPGQVFEIWRETAGVRIQRHVVSREGLVCEREAYDSSSSLFKCGCGRSSVAVTPHGKMNLCLSIYKPQYNLTTGSVAKGWKQMVDLVAAAEPGPHYECSGCSLARNCLRGPNHSWLEKGVFDGSCIDYHRQLAELKAEFLDGSKKGMKPVEALQTR